MVGSFGETTHGKEEIGTELYRDANGYGGDTVNLFITWAAQIWDGTNTFYSGTG